MLGQQLGYLEGEHAGAVAALGDLVAERPTTLISAVGTVRVAPAEPKRLLVGHDDLLVCHVSALSGIGKGGRDRRDGVDLAHSGCPFVPAVGGLAGEVPMLIR